MSTTQGLKLDPSGLMVYVGSNVCSHADIIIPIETAGQLSGEEIGNIVKSLIEQALNLNIEELIDHMAPLQHASNDYLEDLASRFKSYTGSDPIILEGIGHVRSEITRREEQKDSRPVVKAMRRDLQRQYPNLFILIGKRDGFLCAECKGLDNLTIDHRIPLIKGGSNEMTNLQLLCRTCNSRKGAK